ncbi:hypothetical protein BC567DRAFT_266627 [Phyllosticta citribraziliensis]
MALKRSAEMELPHGRPSKQPRCEENGTPSRRFRFSPPVIASSNSQSPVADVGSLREVSLADGIAMFEEADPSKLAARPGFVLSKCLGGNLLPGPSTLEAGEMDFFNAFVQSSKERMENFRKEGSTTRVHEDRSPVADVDDQEHRSAAESVVVTRMNQGEKVFLNFVACGEELGLTNVEQETLNRPENQRRELEPEPEPEVELASSNWRLEYLAELVSGAPIAQPIEDNLPEQQDEPTTTVFDGPAQELEASTASDAPLLPMSAQTSQQRIQLPESQTQPIPAPLIVPAKQAGVYPIQDACASQTNAEIAQQEAQPSLTTANDTALHAETSRGPASREYSVDTEKSFMCDICGDGFTRKCALKRHKDNIHSDKRPFSCSNCAQSFIRNDQLLEHSRWYHGVELPHLPRVSRTATAEPAASYAIEDGENERDLQYLQHLQYRQHPRHQENQQQQYQENQQQQYLPHAQPHVPHLNPLYSQSHTAPYRHYYSPYQQYVSPYQQPPAAEQRAPLEENEEQRLRRA